MTVKLPIDELNALVEILSAFSANGDLTPKEAVDEVLDLLIIAYMNGVDAVSADLDIDPFVDVEEMQDSIYRRIAGETFAERVTKYAAQGQIYDIARVADTEVHRVYNEAAFNTAQRSGASLNKRWVTMNDDRVRDTHYYLEGVVVPLDASFYTYDGDTALYPGGFMLPQNNVNCRCVVEYIPA